ncbi:hypothetical protein H4219_003340 [Mycoemilia scoparia]|uniref:Uncharacterized protein n=1 Tax=Mycoemilia scoparia TaxID=417184 RepID=A0A9W7ZV69_9FUNG|nr:hypothetical protein H4219_003340 [Mycoemilia scoparia]
MADFGFEWQDSSDEEEPTTFYDVPAKVQQIRQESAIPMTVVCLSPQSKSSPDAATTTTTTTTITTSTANNNSISVVAEEELSSSSSSSSSPISNSPKENKKVGIQQDQSTKTNTTISVNNNNDDSNITPIPLPIPTTTVYTEHQDSKSLPPPPVPPKHSPGIKIDTTTVHKNLPDSPNKNDNGPASPAATADKIPSKNNTNKNISVSSPTSPTAEATAAAAGITVEEILEPRRTDPTKEQQVRDMEQREANLNPLQILVRRASSIYVYQRVWSTKEVCKLLQTPSLPPFFSLNNNNSSLPSPPQIEEQGKLKFNNKGHGKSCSSSSSSYTCTLSEAFDIVLPIAMRLADDPDMNVRESMAKSIGPVLRYYYMNAEKYSKLIDGDGDGDVDVDVNKQRNVNTDVADSKLQIKLNTTNPTNMGILSETRKPSLREEDEDALNKNLQTITNNKPLTMAADSKDTSKEDHRKDLMPKDKKGAKYSQSIGGVLASIPRVSSPIDNNDNSDDGYSFSSSSSSSSSSSDSQDEKDKKDKRRSLSPAANPDTFRTWLQNILLSTQNSISLPVQNAVVNLGKCLTFNDFHTKIIHGVILNLMPNDFEQQMQRARSGFIKSRSNSHEPSPTAMFTPPPLIQDNSIISSDSGSSSSLTSGDNDNKSSSSSGGGGGSGYRFGFASLFGRRPSNPTNSIESNNNTGGGNSLMSSSSDLSDTDDYEAANNNDDPRSQRFTFVSPQEEEARAERIRRKLLMLHMVHLTAVEYGVPMRLAVFVPVVDKASKDPSFEVRRDAAAVIGSLSKAVSYDLAYDMLFPGFSRFVSDRVWQVRESAARHSFAGIASVLGIHPNTAMTTMAMMSAATGSPQVNTIQTQRVASEGNLLSVHHPATNFMNRKSEGGGNNIINSIMPPMPKAKKTLSASILPSSIMSLTLTSPKSQTFSIKDASSSSSSVVVHPPQPHRRQTSLQILSDNAYKKTVTNNKHWSTGTPPQKPPNSCTSSSASTTHNTNKHHSAISPLSLSSSSSSFSSTLISPPSISTTETTKVVTEKQWLQLIEKLTGTGEPSAKVRSAFFESIGKILVALTTISTSTNTNVSASAPTTPLPLTANSFTCGDDGGFFKLSRPNSTISIGSDSNSSNNNRINISSPRKLPTYLTTSPKLRDYLVDLIISTVSRAYNKTGYGGVGASDYYYDDVDVRTNAGGISYGNSNSSVPSEIIYHIAFNFPAITVVLGPEGWARIRETYHNLVKMDYFDVRKTLAASVHEIAKISGDQEETLCIFLMEPPEIRKAVLQHLDETLKAFSPKARERCLPIILQVFELEGKEWRTRQLMATQLVSLCSLYSPMVVVQKLLPVAAKWANDPVSGVRQAVAGAFPVVFTIVKDDPNAQVPFFEHVIKFAKSPTFRGRLFFIDMCTSLVLREDPDSDPLEFDLFFLPSLAQLSQDPVVNVRIGLARLVAKLMGNKKRRRASLSRNGESMRGELLADMIDNLKKDKDRDVQDMLKDLL